MLSTTSLLTAVCPLTRVRSIPFSPSFWVDSNPVVQPINCEFSTLWSPPPLLLPKDFVPFFPLLLRFHELCNNVPLGKRKKRRKGNGLQTCSESSKRKSVLYCGYPKSSSSATKKWNCIYLLNFSKLHFMHFLRLIGGHLITLSSFLLWIFAAL